MDVPLLTARNVVVMMIRSCSVGERRGKRCIEGSSIKESEGEGYKEKKEHRNVHGGRERGGGKGWSKYTGK